MKKIVHFSKFFLPGLILSLVLIGAGIAGLVYQGFNLGVDFKGGLIQEIQFAPAAFRLTYSGIGNASISLSRSNLTIVISGTATDDLQYDFPFTAYPMVSDLLRGLQTVNGLTVNPAVQVPVNSAWLIQSAQSSSLLGSQPLVIHYLSPDERIIPIEEVRVSLNSMGTVSVQSLGQPSERRFMIRIDDSEGEVSATQIINRLEASFGSGGIAVSRSDYVGGRVSKQLTDQVWWLSTLTVLLIFGYSVVRFKLQYAIGAVIGIIHDCLIMIAFITWTRMEFNTTTIAALLTILGYSINDTIVVFDRLRENRRIYPDDSYVDVLNRSITETMSRTIITTLTTMLAVISLYIFTTGAMKDFALALLVGMVSGVYSTIFISASFVNAWESGKSHKKKKAEGALPEKT